LSKIFISYTNSDIKEYEELVKHLKPLSRRGRIEVVSKKTINLGENIDNKIRSYTNGASLILVLASIDYLGVEDDEIEIILNSECFAQSRVIVIPLKRCNWKLTFGNLMPLPKEYSDSKFEQMSSEDLWLEVASEVQALLDQQYYLTNSIVARADPSVLEASQEPPKTPPNGMKLKPNEIYCPVEGDSMEPLYYNGDFALARKVENASEILIKNKPKPVYIIRTISQGTIMKHIGEVHKEYYILTSANAKYKPVHIRTDEIHSIYKVFGKIEGDA